MSGLFAISPEDSALYALLACSGGASIYNLGGGLQLIGP